MRLVNADHPLPDDFDSIMYDILDPIPASVPHAGNKYFDSRAMDALVKMITDANANGQKLYVTSAYRNIKYQDALFNSMLQDYMNQGMSHDEAYAKTATIRTPHACSEHSTGLAADIVCTYYTELDDGFGDTDAAKWLLENASNYGFILRYPKDKTEVTGIIWEPWHYRYVGVENARKITESGLCLEEYIAQYGS